MTAALLMGMVLVAGSPQGPSLETLRREHPRLIALPDDAARVRKQIAGDPAVAAIYKRLKKSADELLPAEPVERKFERRSSETMLDVSRKCVDRIYTLATVYRIEGDRRYADRAARELLAVAEFSDWNPRVFLDTAEMTHAVAIGYDWLYEALSKSQRDSIRRALVEKGLREGQRAHASGASWTKARHNWNLVCNGGLTVGALAVADEEPQLAAEVLRAVLASVPRALAEYGPDGAWGEGPGYWNYATHYAVYMMAALDSALGNDFGLSRTPGFASTGDFCMHMIGPTGAAFNFADSSASVKHAATMYWLARKFDKPLYAWYKRERLASTTALDLWWYDPRGSKPADLPTDRWFRHTEVAFLRSAWEDARAVFVGVKAGDNKVNHGHLELGSFVLDANGQRWVHAPGPDSYGLPGYFGSKRWTYYRAGTQGQNTLLIDGKNQDSKAVAPIRSFYSKPDRAHVVADLSAAYAGQAEHVERGLALLQRRQLLVQDEVAGLRGSEVVWQIHTKATVELSGKRALLRQGKETMCVQLLSPSDASFRVDSISLPSPQRPMGDVRRLTIHSTGGARKLCVAVLFTPGSQPDASPPSVKPLASWPRGEGR